MSMETPKFSTPEMPQHIAPQEMDEFEAMLSPDQLVPGSTQEPEFIDKDTAGEGYGYDKPSQETVSTDKGNFYGKTANTLVNATTRIAAVLERLSASAPARQEARAEKIETAKDTVKTVGRSALKGAKMAGYFTTGMAVLTKRYVGGKVEQGKEYVGAKVDQVTTEVRTQVMAVAIEAQKRFDERLAYHEDKHRTAENERLAIENQNNAFASYESNIELSEDHAEAYEVNEEITAQRKADELAMLNEAEQDNIAFNENRNREEAERRKFAEYKAELLAKRLAAFNRKTARRARRQEIYGNVRDKSSELYARAKGGLRRFGRAALKTAKRTMVTGRAAANAAVTAGANAWSESASPTPSN